MGTPNYWGELERRGLAKRKALQGKLAYYYQSAEAEYWDGHWEDELQEGRYQKAEQGRLGELRKAFLTYLPRQGKILEGGCGLGHLVLALRSLGYDCEGIDFAEATVDAVRRLRPDIPIEYGDVTALPVADAYYHGYISLGVVEHREEGPEPFLQEAHRVLAEDGIAIFTTPTFSPLRKLKANLGYFSRVGKGELPFYQYAYSREALSEYLWQAGFEVIDGYRYNAPKGLSDEIPFLKSWLEVRSIRKWAKSSPWLNRFCGHAQLLVCQKRRTPKVCRTSNGRLEQEILSLLPSSGKLLLLSQTAKPSPLLEALDHLEVSQVVGESDIPSETFDAALVEAPLESGISLSALHQVLSADAKLIVLGKAPDLRAAGFVPFAPDKGELFFAFRKNQLPENELPFPLLPSDWRAAEKSGLAQRRIVSGKLDYLAAPFVDTKVRNYFEVHDTPKPGPEWSFLEHFYPRQGRVLHVSKDYHPFSELSVPRGVSKVIVSLDKRVAQASEKLKIIHANPEHLPFAADTFSGVFLDEPQEAVLAELKRVLLPDGVLLLAVFRASPLESLLCFLGAFRQKVLGMEFYRHAWKESELQSLLSQSGFSVLKKELHTSKRGTVLSRMFNFFFSQRLTLVCRPRESSSLVRTRFESRNGFFARDSHGNEFATPKSSEELSSYLEKKLGEKRLQSIEKGNLSELRNLLVKNLPKEGSTLELEPGERCLFLALRARGYDCAAFDSAEEVVNRLLSLRSDAPIALAEPTALPLKGGTCAAILGLDVVERQEDPEALFAELRRVLEPEGLLVLGVRLRGRYRKCGEAGGLAFLRKRYSKEGFLELLKKEGFDIQTTETFGGPESMFEKILDRLPGSPALFKKRALFEKRFVVVARKKTREN